MGKKKEREKKRKYLCVKHIQTYYFMESSEILYLVISSAFIEEKISVRLSDFAKIVEFPSGKAREPRVNPKSTVLQSILPAYKWYTPSKVVSKSSAYQKQEMKKRKNVLCGVSQDGISNCEVLDMSMEPGPSVELNVPSLLKKWVLRPAYQGLCQPQPCQKKR